MATSGFLVRSADPALTSVLTWWHDILVFEDASLLCYSSRDGDMLYRSLQLTAASIQLAASLAVHERLWAQDDDENTSDHILISCPVL